MQDDLVPPRRSVTRVQHAVGQLPFVREKKQTLRHEVQPPNMKQLAHALGQEAVDGGSALGVLASADITGRLVEGHPPGRCGLHPTAVHFDHASGANARARLRDESAVHPDAPVGDQLLARTPRRNAGSRQVLLEPDALFRQTLAGW